MSLYTLHNNVYIWCCFYPRSPVFVCLFSGGWDRYGRKTYPILQPLWPCSLTPYSYFFFFTPHTASSSPNHADRHTHAHAPTAPVAPPRLLRVEQGDPGPMRQAVRGGGGGGWGNQGRTCPGSAFWSSSRQGDRSAVTPALEETAPSSGGGDGPPSFALR